MSYRTYRSVLYRYWCRTELTDLSGALTDVVPNLSKCPVPVLMLYGTCWSVRYRCWCFTELTEVSGTSIDAVPNLLKCPVPISKSVSVPVLMPYRTYQSVWHRYWCCTERIEVSGTGIDVVPNLPKCLVPVWNFIPITAVPVSMSYRTYRSVRYRYWCRTELTEVSGTGNTGGIYHRYASVPILPHTPLASSKIK